MHKQKLSLEANVIIRSATETLKKNDKDEYVEEVTPQNTDPFGIVYRFFVNQKDADKYIKDVDAG